MNQRPRIEIGRTRYDKAACQTGLVHLGFGAFHRAHQAVYLDDYMEKTGDLRWGVAAVNLRGEESAYFARHKDTPGGYLLKTTSPNGVSSFREVRPHVQFEDWSNNAKPAEELLSLPSVKAVSMTVTESGYYLNDDWSLNTQDPVIAAEIEGRTQKSVYAYLARALKRRIEATGAPITILCCDNIRSNGDKLEQNFKRYLEVTGQSEICEWLDENATFPNSMVDRITPRATDNLKFEISNLSIEHAETAIHGETFAQWVLQDDFASDFPDLERSGVEIVADVHPYEEAKIRILNGGHTALCYMGALAGHQTFDEVMADPELQEHFYLFQKDNVLPGLTLDLPFFKKDYLKLIAERFSNKAIADDLARICMDGWSKFPIFVRPTLSSCLSQGIEPVHSYTSIAAWYVYARRFAAGKMPIPYNEPYWEQLEPLLKAGKEADFASHKVLWSDLPEKHTEFVSGITSAIREIEKRWPA